MASILSRPQCVEKGNFVSANSDLPFDDAKRHFGGFVQDRGRPGALAEGIAHSLPKQFI